MKTIIAGSRTITQLSLVAAAVQASGFQITEVVSGGARGVDQLGEVWAGEHGVPVKHFLAKWGDLNTPGAFIKHGPHGCYNARAGFDRNQDMAEYADALILIWDGESHGSRHMLNRAKAMKLKIHEVTVEVEG